MSISLTPKGYPSRQTSLWYKYWKLQLGPRRLASSKKLPGKNEDILGILHNIRKDIKASGLAEANNDSPRHEEPRNQEEDFSFEHMPLSPLIDKKLIEARIRYREPKPLPSKERTDFQKLIDKNPYGTWLKHYDHTSYY